jgi:hypothetical protein
VVLLGLVLKVGPLSLSVILYPSDPAPQIPESIFYHYYIWQVWCDSFLPRTTVFAFFAHTLSRNHTALFLGFVLFCAFSRR